MTLQNLQGMFYTIGCPDGYESLSYGCAPCHVGWYWSVGQCIECPDGTSTTKFARVGIQTCLDTDSSKNLLFPNSIEDSAQYFAAVQFSKSRVRAEQAL